MTVVTRPDGELIFVAGSTRSGKTTWIVHQVRAWRRLLVWDVKSEWWRHGCRALRSPLELRELVAKNPPALERAAYVPRAPRREFDYFCRLAWWWIVQARSAVVVEELAVVTHPGKAPDSWLQILSQGLALGPAIYAGSQRPAESDKTAIGNASRVHCHRMMRPDDELYMAKWLRVPVERVAALQPFEWIERDAWGQVTPGKGLQARASRAQKRPKESSKGLN